MLKLKKCVRVLFQNTKYFKKMLNLATSWIVMSKYKVSNLGPTLNVKVRKGKVAIKVCDLKLLKIDDFEHVFMQPKCIEMWKWNRLCF